MDEVYRGYRIAVKLLEGVWHARITEARGGLVPATATAMEAEGPELCVQHSRAVVDRYVLYLSKDQ